MLDELDDTQRSLLQRTTNFYSVKFRNHGGIVMPIIVRLHYADSTNEIVRIPVQIWRSNGDEVSKLFVSEKEVVRIELDPYRETADTESSNNHWPPKLIPSRSKLYKSKSSDNEMRKAKRKKEADEKKAAEEQKKAAQEADQANASEPNAKGTDPASSKDTPSSKSSDAGSAEKKLPVSDQGE